MAQTLTTAPATSRMKTLQPVCPACGGLECLCRPRFFAGQLLTEEDLNRLDHYIVEKNKLHNRYLHGWGVVCGLEVFCHPCEGQVTVTSGYALSPCGDDIVLCADDIVNVCDLIQRCRERERLDCEPPRPAASAECQDVKEQWVLTVCFTEKASRGVTALRGSSEPGMLLELQLRRLVQLRLRLSGKRHGPEAAGAGIPLCALAVHRRALRPRPVRADGHLRKPLFLPLQSVGCRSETGRSARRDDSALRGLSEGFVRCRAAVAHEHRAGAGMVLPAEAELHRLFRRSSDSRLPRAAESLAVRMSGAEPESDAGSNIKPQCSCRSRRLSPSIFVRASARRCCRPVPIPPVSNCVPLATITIRKRDCKIMRVCNWSVRKFVTTFPNLQYWLSFLPFVRTLRQLIEIGCCRPFNRLSNSSGLVSGAAQLVKRFTAFRRAAMEINPEQEFSRVLLGAIANRDRTIDAQTLFLGAMEFQDDKQRPLMTDAELRNPLQYLLINQLAPSLVRNVVPDEDVGAAADAVGEYLAYPGLAGSSHRRMCRRSQARSKS